MKKSIITITLITLMLFALSSMAYLQVFKDVPFANICQYGEENAGGKALVNYNPPNSTDPDSKKTGVVIQATFWGLNPENEYTLNDWYSSTKITFSPNKSGNASVHMSLIHDARAKELWVLNKTKGYTVLKAIPPLPDPEI